ncbi:cob(I)yrinic acid a,c-diamide adenosyltransferase [Acidocella sp.]|uniref:cob(I)yrinic acid a,c-diamide adenosyltransferase n=1 Tax=Acidocella sp. TaxID=50710 RepID=UPI0026021919|nr:cob(I)yrinic acid a,c-diamide adenosyltransferase [Acidocella sp.]
MVRLDRIVTRGGDGGETSLGDGTRLPKSAPRIAALGEVDEANAAIGVARTQVPLGVAELLGRIQNDLFDVGADLCLPLGQERPALRVSAAQVEWLEGEIGRLNESLAPLTSFVLPGGTPGAAFLHLARTVVRRAERAVVHLAEAPGETLNRLVLIYLNRLSDLLFVLARVANAEGAGDVAWEPGRDGG